MRLHYDKLIRDRIPEIIETDGKRCRVEVMEAAGAPVTRLIAVGGGTRSGLLWPRIVSDVTGLPQQIPARTVGASYGTSLLAAGLVHGPRMSAYNATKAGAVAIGETLDAELRPRGIATTVICPQFFQSGLADSLTGDDESADELARKLLGSTSLTSELIAKRAMRGIRARRNVVTPDLFATLAWYSKRYARVPYLLSTRLIGRAVDKRG